MKPNQINLIRYLGLAVIITLLINVAVVEFGKSVLKEIDYGQFLTMIQQKEIETVQIEEDRILIVPRKTEDSSLELQKKMYYTGKLNDPNLTEKLYESGVKFSTPVKTRQSPITNFILTWILPIGILYFISSFLMNSMNKKFGGGMMSFGKNTAKVYMEKKTGITFKDVAGQEEAKESLNELVDFLHHPAKYTKIGAKLPKGALLVGPPGTGKTLLAKAVAGEASVPFFSLSGSDFVEMFVGVGASRVRDLFKQAEQHAPCIIFIDEIDAIGKSREGQLGGNDEREQTLNQLLAEMDGFDSSRGVVILAATNRPEVLDKALLRPGRFDRRVIVDKPDLKGRTDILKVHARNVVLDAQTNLEAIAVATSGAAGADLANIINEAALRAVRLGRDKVLQEDLFEAVEIIIAGKEKKDRILTPKEKGIVAFHEVGHALAAALQKQTQPVHKITIVPRTMGALGYTMQMPEEERYLMSKEEMLNQITVLLAGRAAEEVEFGVATTGASNDIERATQLARQMVTQYGMSERFGMMGLESSQSRYLDGRPVQTCGNETASVIDNEVLRIISECFGKAKRILEENRNAMRRIAQFLIEKETITGREFMELLQV